VIIYLKKETPENIIEDILGNIRQGGIDAFYIEPYNLIISHKFHNKEIFQAHPYVENQQLLDTSYKLSSREFKSNNTTINIKGVEIGNNHFNMIAGPCAIENEEQIFGTAEYLNQLDVKFIRGGAYKPRTSPYTFRGLGIEGLKLIRAAADKYDLRVVTELIDLKLLDEIVEYSDIIQIGSRNQSNFYLLSELGKINKPVLLKRGMQSKVEEWLLAADYILSGGNEKLILCERGIRSFDPSSRNLMDIGVIPLIKSLSHLPIFADPSHGTGDAKFVHSMSLSSIAAGANGLMIEVHPNPTKSVSDSKQALGFSDFKTLLNSVEDLAKYFGKSCDFEISDRNISLSQ